MKSRYHSVLAIAGSDSGGGAGIQADIKTISACGCYAASAITAITAQNTLGVQKVFGLPPHIVGSQIDSVLGDIGADAVKIGMLHDSELILTIREKLLKWNIRNIIIDPVMVSTSGHRLIEESAIDDLRSRLLPIAGIITPNLPEAEILLGRKIESQEQLPQCAYELSRMYSTHKEADGSTRKVSV
ncbi:MAG: bifunctional hydroxymethylpyrimidine kinase/phosphomethylpyrimidine kinase, partial [Alistipes sp.]|nr:bifunctional hydroxymethylpyrimidine kinase/phosphomethylpyrimidine kinase [Candidatus Minthomonas equi]